MRARLNSATALTLALAALMAASGAEAGLDTLHKQRVEGGKVCFIDHWHYKSSGAWPTQGEAESAAVKAWNRFTSAEYGARWGDVRLGAGVDVQCAPSTGDRGLSWSCNLKARPCRR